jgi:hypothetical protein
MAIINKTGITNGGTIQSEHITRAIDALSGVSTDSIVATGSLQGTASFALTASYAMNGGGGSSVTASYALTASKIQVSDSTSAAGPLPILLSFGTTGASRLVISDQTDFAFNPIANRLTVASISSTTSAGGEVTMTASFASTASVTMQLRYGGPVPVNPPDGTLYMSSSDPELLWVYSGGNWFNFGGASGGTPSP